MQEVWLDAQEALSSQKQSHPEGQERRTAWILCQSKQESFRAAPSLDIEGMFGEALHNQFWNLACSKPHLWRVKQPLWKAQFWPEGSSSRVQFLWRERQQIELLAGELANAKGKAVSDAITFYFCFEIVQLSYRFLRTCETLGFPRMWLRNPKPRTPYSVHLGAQRARETPGRAGIALIPKLAVWLARRTQPVFWVPIRR